MSLPDNIREEFIDAMKPFASKDIPDSVRFLAFDAAEGLFKMAKVMGVVNDVIEVEKITYANGKLVIGIDGEDIEIEEDSDES